MPTPTYDLLASSTPSSGVSSVEFTNLNTLASGYRDLIIVATMIGKSFAPIDIQLNNSSSSIYSWVRMTGTGSVAESDSATTTAWRTSSYSLDTNQRGLIITNLFDFSQTDKHKTALMRFNAAERATDARALRFASTSAVTSIKIYYDGNTYPANCSIYLYGIVS